MTRDEQLYISREIKTYRELLAEKLLDKKISATKYQRCLQKLIEWQERL